MARKVLATTNFVSHLILPTNLIPPRRRGGHRGRGTAEDEGSLIMPLSIPLITGPGAITTAITLAYQGDQIDPLIATLIGVGVVAVIIFVSMDYLGGLISEVSDRTMELLLRPGGLVLATLGVQILPGGVMRYFGL
ncbi:small neutral amino acid transporter SnatA (MarC family) [Methanofollis sp. W23]|nr:small neutral amino acid transporter SnatA (MarC family) [Methanofollis sp. W23]